MITPEEAVNVAMLLPGGMVTEPGTLKAAALLAINAVAPPGGAGPDNSTVHGVLELLARPD